MLHVIPTPIGNLEDITRRALKLFEKADFVLCEDGRITSKLFTLLKIQNKPSYINLSKDNKFNYSGVKYCLETNLRNTNFNTINVGSNETDKTIILVSDAGTPCISDPGFEVIKLAKQLHIDYTVLPGASAFSTALVASGFGGSGFKFLGFLPLKKGRTTVWKKIKEADVPIVLYESVHRITKLLAEIQTYLEPERQICICQELTKLNENYLHTKVNDLDKIQLIIKGEFVVVINSKAKVHEEKKPTF